MLNVTEASLCRLSRKLTRKKVAADMAFRFTHTSAGWSLGPDRARSADTVFTHDGRNVLFLDQAVSRAMTHLTLRVGKTATGPRLRLRRMTNEPN
ncbi:MAG: hypothetical protein HOP29_10320 [Phycisphaerales bacterium]|nr:hypothetical protein [Phycisphaerales bacterium]